MTAYSWRRLAGKRLLGAVSVLTVQAFLFGCSHKDEAPSAPGYYTGPMTKATKMNAKAPKGGD